MDKHLTPSNIALLLLIKLYCCGYVPPAGQLPVIAFITSRIIPEATQSLKRQPKSKANPTGHFALPLPDLRSLLSPYTSTLRNTLGTTTQNKNLWDFFGACLCAIDSLDTLLEDIKGLEELLIRSKVDGPPGSGQSAGNPPVSTGERFVISGFSTESISLDGSYSKTVLSKGSLFGVYVAQMQVEFEKLKFEDAMRVWRDYELYRDPLMQEHAALKPHGNGSLAQMNAISGGRLFDIINHSLEDDKHGQEQANSADVEKMLGFQINQMQKFGALLPLEIRRQLKQLIASAGSKSNLNYYVKFLEAWHQGDYTSSFENLHRYYDYAMLHTDQSHYQYALLNMAILQADFGSFSEAAAAMKETIATARENKDMNCLNYCLSWMYRFDTLIGEQATGSVLKNVLQGTEGDGLGLLYLKSAAREQGMRSIESQAMLHEASICLSKGHRPLEAFERLYESSNLILHHELNGMRASQVLAQCYLYTRLGVIPLANSMCNAVQDCFSRFTTQGETIHARCRNAYMITEYSLKLSLLGKYELALEVLYKSREDAARQIKSQHYLAQSIGIIKLKRALHHNNLFHAERLIATLKTTPIRDPNLTFIALLLEIDHKVRLGNFDDAFSLINAHLSPGSDLPFGDVYQRIRLLNAKAFLFAKTGRPQKAFSISLRAATAAYRSKNALALWESIAAVVVVLNGVKAWNMAVELAESAIYQAIETEDLAMVAQLRTVGADSLVGRAGALNDSFERRKTMKEALYWLESAAASYEELEDYRAQCEMTVKAQTILEFLRDEKGVKEKSDKIDQIEALITQSERPRTVAGEFESNAVLSGGQVEVAS